MAVARDGITYLNGLGLLDGAPSQDGQLGLAGGQLNLLVRHVGCEGGFLLFGLGMVMDDLVCCGKVSGCFR